MQLHSCLILCCAVLQLVHAAYTRWCEEESVTVDDITAVVVFLNHGEKKHTTGYQV